MIIATRLTAIKKRESLNGKREERERERVVPVYTNRPGAPLQNCLDL